MNARPDSGAINGEPRRSTVIDIAPQGDIVLSIHRNNINPEEHHNFRVTLSTLQSSSQYFATLFGGRFGEADRIQKEHSHLCERYGSLKDVPIEELPFIEIKDVGRISAVKSIEPLCKDFFHILHDHDLDAVLPVANLANLAVVADRFDALDKVGGYVRRKKFIRAIEGKTTPKAEAALAEEKVRQRLLIGVLLDHGPWVKTYSARLIIKGWIGREPNDTEALWWDLPRRFEDELVFRREHILSTIQSLQMHFVGLYTSRARQCKLGYDSSIQCDSFQLGELIRFFTRVGTLYLQGNIVDDSEPLMPYAGDIHSLIDTLRQAPEYQIDKNHSHCGIRTRLTPLLDLLQEALLDIGICLDCASDQRLEHRWIDSKQPLLWKKQTFRPRGIGHQMHAQIKVLFTASDRDWTS